MLKDVLNRLRGKPEFQLPLATRVSRAVELPPPELLHLPLRQVGDAPLVVDIEVGASVSAGAVLARSEEAGFVLPSPVSGTVTGILDQPDIRGGLRGSAVLVKPSDSTTEPAFPTLDPEHAAPDRIVERLREAGVISSLKRPRPLLEELRPADGGRIDTVVVLAADRDPGVSVALHLTRDRAEDIAAAARLLGRVAGAGRVVLATLESEVAAFAGAEGLQLLPLEPEYPSTMAGIVARAVGGGAGVRVVPIESALAALDAVREGRVQKDTWLTLIGPDQSPVANYRVPIGTPIRKVLEHAGIEPGDRDKVVVGGPMRGFAVHSTAGSVDAGVEALTIVPAEAFPRWTTDPCVNCGRCIDRCPVDLQVQLIARYSEFGLFDRTVEYDIDQCFECGLCASVCTARRPLLQYIRLAMKELEASA